MVLQRWQSVLLFIAVVAIALFPLFPIIQFSTSTTLADYSVSGLAMHNISSNANAVISSMSIYSWGFIAINTFIAIFIFITIFRYKSLLQQMRLCILSIIFVLFLCISLAISSYLLMDILQAGDYTLKYAVVCPIVAILAIILAYVRIKKDDKKIRSYDRIR
ncbi:MAG: DUF4293 domain-containing protein [Muribaculaceae bacterium]